MWLPVHCFLKSAVHKNAPFVVAADSVQVSQHFILCCLQAASDHYAPRFNGYCTVMVSRGIKYEANPELWKIADGKLWVFGGPKAVTAFDEKKEDVIAKATENWPKVSQQPAQAPN